MASIILIYILIFSIERRIEVIPETYEKQIISARGFYGGNNTEFEVEDAYFSDIYELVHIIPVKKYSPYTEWSRSRIQFDVLDAYGFDITFGNGEHIIIVQDNNMLCLHVTQNGESKKFVCSSKWEIEYMDFWYKQADIVKHDDGKF